MDEIIKTKTSNVQTITSIEVAEMMKTEHWKILRKLEGQEKNGKHIPGYIEILGDNEIVVTDYFIKSSYITGQNKKMPCYLITKLGCDFLANKFTGEKGVLFTAKYVKKFDEMEKTLYHPTYTLPTTYKEALVQLLEQVEQNEKLLEDNNHKQEVINGFTNDITIYDKTSIMNRICKRRHENYANRYKELYKCFRETFHIDLEARCEGYNLKQQKKKDRLTTIRYAEKFGHTDNLYSCCVKLYETEVNEILEELHELQN